MPADPTTGRDITGSGAALLAFVAIAAVWTLVLQRVMPDPFDRTWARRWSWGLVAVLGVGGAVAMLVGLACWATGTQFT